MLRLAGGKGVPRALSFARRRAVRHCDRVRQVGWPRLIFRHPISRGPRVRSPTRRLPDCRHRRGGQAARCLLDRVLWPSHIVPTRGVPSGRARCPRKVRADFQTQAGRDWTAASPANAADGRVKARARFSARRHRIQKRSGPCESPLPIDRPVAVRGRHDKERAGSLASPPALALRLRRKFIHRADRRGRKKIFDFSRAGKRDRNVYQALQGDLALSFKKLVGGRR